MKKKIGIIGYGWVARANHRNSYRLAKDAEIVAVCDISPKALERAGEDFGLTNDCLFTDYRQLIDSGKCDVKVIRTESVWKGVTYIEDSEPFREFIRQEKAKMKV